MGMLRKDGDVTVPEANLTDSGAGLVPESGGWFIVNFAEARGFRTDRFGAAVRFEGENHFPDLAFNVRVLQPGQPNCLYHRESQTEAFLVLEGECIAIVEDEERPMRKGDFLYAPPGTAHVFVGAGEGPCTIVMVSSRIMPEELLYPVSEVAGRYGASVAKETESADAAYAGGPPREPVRLELPW
jgi:uncharacterized cupin superfamily protein